MDVLLIEDSEADAILIMRELRKHYPHLASERVMTEVEFEAALKKKHWDIVLSDYNLPGFSALLGLQLLKRLELPIPFIVISGAIGEESVVELMREGADDLILKSKLVRLQPSVERSLRESRLRTSQKESMIAATQAIQSREQMLAVVTHDLKTPLGAMNLNVQLLQRLLDNPKQLDQQAKATQHLDRLKRSIDRMTKLVNDILDVAKLESGNFSLDTSENSVAELISQVLDLFEPLAQQKSILLEARVDEDVLCEYDHDRLIQVFMNVTGNALKFTPEGGAIQIVVHKDEEVLHFSVSDSGSGIPEEDLPHVFDRFWQAQKTQKLGTGLGLAIARGIIEAHDGKIWIESVFNTGTTVHFTIPVKSRSL